LNEGSGIVLWFARKDVGALFIAGTIGLSACLFTPSAPAAVLYDQTGFPQNAALISSSSFTSDLTKAARGADDFTVPAGATWQISSVDVVGTTPSGLTAGVFIYGNAGLLPGALLFQQTGIPIAGTYGFSAPISGAPALGPGTYWVSVQTSGATQWSWSTSQTTAGHTAVWGNPANGYGTGCTSFTPLPSCDSFSPSQSFLFRLNAPDPVAPVPATTTTVKKKKCKNKKYRRHHKKKCKKRKRR
jgi:hypothetical protein